MSKDNPFYLKDRADLPKEPKFHNYVESYNTLKLF